MPVNPRELCRDANTPKNTPIHCRRGSPITMLVPIKCDFWILTDWCPPLNQWLMIPVQRKTWAVELRTHPARDNHISDLAQFNNNNYLIFIFRNVLPQHLCTLNFTCQAYVISRTLSNADYVWPPVGTNWLLLYRGSSQIFTGYILYGIYSKDISNL